MFELVFETLLDPLSVWLVKPPRLFELHRRRVPFLYGRILFNFILDGK
jgi:hypothetical protein